MVDIVASPTYRKVSFAPEVLNEMCALFDINVVLAPNGFRLRMRWQEYGVDEATIEISSEPPPTAYIGAIHD